MTALVVVEFPTIRLVMDASVATREEKNPLVEVLLVIVELVAAKLVVKKLVDVELVIRDADAKIFCTKRLRNLLSDEPSAKVASILGTIFPTVEVPMMVRLAIVVVARVEVPIIVNVPEPIILPPTFKLPPVFWSPEIVDVPT